MSDELRKCDFAPLRCDNVATWAYVDGDGYLCDEHHQDDPRWHRVTDMDCGPGEPCPDCDGGRAFTLRPDNLGNVVRDYSCLECGSTGEIVRWNESA